MSSRGGHFHVTGRSIAFWRGCIDARRHCASVFRDASNFSSRPYGDILITGTEILVRTSDRTNFAGIATLTRIVANWGYHVRAVNTPPGVLHFKTECSLLDNGVVLSTQRLACSGCFSAYDVILTRAGEEAVANAIRFNDLVIMPTGFPATRTRLEAAGYDVRSVNNSECAKIDGGMSCSSLRLA